MTPDQAASSLVAHAIPFTLVLFRMAGVFIMAPILSSTMIPLRARALLATTMAGAAYANVAPHVQAPADVDLLGLAPLIVSEALIGLTVGAIASTPLLCLELSGVMMGQSIGFGLARVYNPDTDIDTDLLAQLLLMIAVGVFVAAGGLEALFGAVARSFERVPIGGMRASQAPLDVLLGALQSGFDLGLRVAMPVVGTTLLLIAVLGVIGKTMPQINIMTVGFAIKILAGLAILALATTAIHEAARDAIADSIDAAVLWLRRAGGA
ncbi:MAG: flagellar biosynthetic protein FliR [Planctomycetota bacterium]|nr:flagellar biosynthetic protein FliR [Planctomycetota bacterium]